MLIIKRILFFMAVAVMSFTAFAQNDNSELGTSPQKLAEQLKNTTLVVEVYDEQSDDMQKFMDAFEKHWTFNKYIFVSDKNIDRYNDPAFSSISYEFDKGTSQWNLEVLLRGKSKSGGAENKKVLKFNIPYYYAELAPFYVLRVQRILYAKLNNTLMVEKKDKETETNYFDNGFLKFKRSNVLFGQFECNKDKEEYFTKLYSMHDTSIYISSLRDIERAINNKDSSVVIAYNKHVYDISGKPLLQLNLRNYTGDQSYVSRSGGGGCGDACGDGCGGGGLLVVYYLAIGLVVSIFVFASIYK